MTTRKGIHISGNYVVHRKLYAFFIHVLCILKNESSNRIVFYIAIKLNDHQTRCFNFRLR